MKILVIFAHPKLSGSVVQNALLAAISGLPNVTVHDLYAAHPHFVIDVPAEQQLLLVHDLIVLQHPFYWYSSPAIIKEWLDLVLENGWAYGPGGTRLSGKFMMQAVSTGGSEGAYQMEGRNRFTVNHLLVPFNQTAFLCGMANLEAFAIHAGRRMAPPDLAAQAKAYHDLIVGLRDGRIDPLAMLAPGYRLPPAFHTRAA